MMVAEQMEEWVIVRVGMEVEEGECSGDARDGERGSRREAPRLVAQASWGFGGGGGGACRACAKEEEEMQWEVGDGGRGGGV
ncbi:uncharacterized protein COLE_04378 [Cutaneotrichosporon oleaginosum]|uniref:uncharacterized protein n=1 Tax=Cutaneotrichosporon oleaginosum TaxID=879819 RepID=UPI001329E184|nr:hypothetical protein COLE_04378 [Cutaneotrichosporon oleaginosum]